MSRLSLLLCAAAALSLQACVAVMPASTNRVTAQRNTQRVVQVGAQASGQSAPGPVVGSTGSEDSSVDAEQQAMLEAQIDAGSEVDHNTAQSDNEAVVGGCNGVENEHDC